MGRLFSIGKVIQVRVNSLCVSKLAFIETEEHIRHVVEMLNWLYPSASALSRYAASLHDIGKKIYLQSDFVQNGRKRDGRLTRKNLIADFYQQDVQEVFGPSDAIERYFAFLSRNHVRCYLVRRNPQDPDSEIVAARYHLDPPFGNHAASIEIEDLQNVPESDLRYVHSLIHLHHNFQVDKLVAVAAQYGESIITDLYRLMTADQEGSQWAEYVVQKLEGGEEKPQGGFGFSEFAVEVTAEPREILREGAHVRGSVVLRSERQPHLGERTLEVDYYVSEYDLTPQKFLAPSKKGGRGK